MVGIVVVGPSGQFSVDRCPPASGMLLLLQHQCTATLTNHKAVSVHIKWTAGVEWIPVAAGKRLGIGQRVDHQGAQDGLCPYHQNGICIIHH